MDGMGEWGGLIEIMDYLYKGEDLQADECNQQ